jgi:acyl-CoA thioesterase I
VKGQYLTMAIQLKKNAAILFQGDSITDCGCREGNILGLGRGYVYIAASLLLAKFPQLKLTIVNKGISGNRVQDLAGRWDRDCLAIKPDVLSIMIGINDTWRAFDSNDPTATDTYYSAYHSILKKTRDKLGDIPIILCEPFLLPYPEDRKA